MTYLSSLVEADQIKPCLNIMLEHGAFDAYYPRCTEKWASRVAAKNVATDPTAYTGPSSYSWPQCPENCPHFTKSDNFIETASRDQYEEPDTESEEITASNPPMGEPVVEPSKAELEPPSKITIPWLLMHVPVRLWILAASIIGAAFVFGVHASQWDFIKQIFGLN